MTKSQDTQTNIYYIKNNYIFSDKKNKIELFNPIETIDIPQEINFLKNNKQIIEQLDKIISNKPKTLEITGLITNSEETINNLEKKYKTNKSIFDKADETKDYEFIEKTSQIDIINQLIVSSDKQDITLLNEKVSEYIKDISDQEKRKNATLNEQIIEEENSLKIAKENKEKYMKENICSFEEKIKLEEEIIEKKLKEKEKIENLFNKKDEKNKLELENNILENKIEKIKFKIEDNKLNSEIIKQKITQIEDKIKLGKKKCTNPILFIATLGLIYWTPFSDCKYIKMQLHSKISKIKEKNLNLERKLNKIKNDIENKKKIIKTTNIEISKKQEELNSQIEKIDEKIKIKQSEIRNLKEIINSNQKELKEYFKKIEEVEIRLKNLKNIKKEFEENSNETIQNKIKIIEEIRNEKIEIIEDIKNKLEKQKINIKGNWIVKIK